MKARFSEDECGFFIVLEAETFEDASTLVRFGINKVKKVKYMEVFAFRDGTISMQGYLEARKQRSSEIGFTK